MSATTTATLEDRRLVEPHGELVLRNPAPGVFESVATGRLDLVAGRAYVEFGDQVRAQRAPRFGLHDWLGLVGYSVAVRPLVVSWAIRAVFDFQEIHVALRSPVVRMGVTLANVAIGGRVTIHDDLAGFAAVRERLGAAAAGR